MNGSRWVAGALLLAVVGSACGVGSSSEAVEEAVAFDCAFPIAVFGTPGADGVAWVEAAGVAAFVDREINQRGRFVDRPSGQRLWFSKIALAVRSGSAFVVTGMGESAPVLEWGQVGGPVEAIAVDGCAATCSTVVDQPACPNGATGEWAVYPGGLWSEEPGCYEVEVRTDATAERVRFGLGEACAT